MTDLHTPKANPKTSINELNSQVLIATQNSLLMCTLSMEYLDRLGALFGGIVAASNGDTVPLELAKLGKYLVDDFHNTMDCYREENQNYLGTLSKEQA
nr:hypothetical protein [uncultured Undibacterium sp.]